MCVTSETDFLEAQVALPKLLVLLVEDRDDVRMLVQDALEDAGFQIEIAVSGTEAIAALDAANGELRGLITDIELGAGPDGWAVARHARELDGSIAVVYMSGARMDEWAVQGVPLSSMVPKPFAAVQIVTALANLLNIAHQP